MRGIPLTDEALDGRVAGAFDAETRSWSQALHGADPAWAIDYFVRFFHNPLSRHVPLEDATAIECASGLGYNALAFVLAGGRSITGYDLSEQRVAHARELARRLGLADRARFEVRNLYDLPFTSADVVFSLQTLEHVPEPLQALRILADRTRVALVLSTPNRLYPKDGHDTGLLFAHWLPTPVRRRYARLRGAPVQQLCRFLSPFELERALPDFSRATKLYNFDDLDEWLEQYPCFFPYGAGGGRWLPARSQRPRWRAAKVATRLAPDAARLTAPMIEGIYLRNTTESKEERHSTT